jgi:hypothetical protein
MSLIPFNAMMSEISSALSRKLTGQLFTETQIHKITSQTTGQCFAELFPEPKDEQRARERVEEARGHIKKASALITGMKSGLELQAVHLDKLLQEVEEKKNMAEGYERLAKTHQEEWDAFRNEMETALRKELISQSEQGKTMRRVASSIIWLATLIIGVALGAYLKEIVDWTKGIFTVL